jgi:hypothetical protein
MVAGSTTRQWSQTILLLPLLTGGCATHALWTSGNLDAWNEPAQNADVRLFDAAPKKDFLVVYDEYSERHDSIHTRAYFLNQSQKRVAQGQRPHFVSIHLASKPPPIPVLYAPPSSNTNFSQTLCALVSTNNQSFTIYSGERSASYSLPVYNDGRGRTYRLALTPVAVVADITIVGGVLGYWWLVGTAESGYSTP